MDQVADNLSGLALSVEDKKFLISWLHLEEVTTIQCITHCMLLCHINHHYIIRQRAVIWKCCRAHIKVTQVPKTALEPHTIRCQ